MSKPIYEILEDGRVAIDPTTWRPARSALFVFCHLMYPQDENAELYQYLKYLEPNMGAYSQTLAAEKGEETLKEFLRSFASPYGTLEQASKVFSNLMLTPVAITATLKEEKEGEDLS